MTSKFSRFYPILAEWSILGGFVLLGDVAAQKIEHITKSPSIVVISKSDDDMNSVLNQERNLLRNTLPGAVTIEDMNAKETSCYTEKPTISNHLQEEESFRLDHSRLISATCTGLLWIAPISMIWFPLLHRFMAKYFAHLIEGSLKYISTKVILENVCLAGPVCLGYFAIPTILEVQHEWWSVLCSRLAADFWPSLATDVSFWCIISPVNYKVIPVR
jgi:hypothetical protein